MARLRELGDKLSPLTMNALRFGGAMITIGIALFLALKCATLIAPFIVAYLVSIMVEPLVRFFTKRMRMSRTIASTVSVLLVVAILFTVVGVVSIKLIVEARDFAIQLPGMYNGLVTRVDETMKMLDDRYDFFDADTVRMINEVFANVRTQLFGLVNTITRGVWATAVSLPQVIVTLIVTLLGTFFMVRDRSKLAVIMHRQLPESYIRRFTAIRDDLFSALFGYIRALLILMTVTFIELTIGFSLVGVEYAILFALIISILDALPVLGTGTFVVPWALYNFAVGEYRTAIGLLVVFCFVWVVRQLLEPHIVGDQIGIHPLLTLLSMYLGMQWMGVLGMIAGPVLLIVLRNLVRVYTGGQPMREVLYRGIEMPPEEKEKSARIQKTESPESPSLTERVFETLRKWFAGKR